MKKEYDVETVWTAYPLNTKIPEDGVDMTNRYRDSGRDMTDMNMRLKKAADGVGLPISPRKMSYNSRMAHEVSKWATSQGKGDAFHFAVFQALFVAGKNIAKPDVLLEIVASLNLPVDEAKAAINTSKFSDAVDADFKRSLKIDPEYVPSFMIDNDLLENPHRYDTRRFDLIEAFMEKHGIKRN